MIRHSSKYLGFILQFGINKHPYKHVGPTTSFRMALIFISKYAKLKYAQKKSTQNLIEQCAVALCPL